MARRRLSALVVRVAVAGAWSALLVVGGLVVIVEWGQRFRGYGWLCTLGGATMIAMGEFVFTTVVADRLFPGASRRVTNLVELTAGGVFVAGLAFFAARFVLATGS